MLHRVKVSVAASAHQGSIAKTRLRRRARQANAQGLYPSVSALPEKGRIFGLKPSRPVLRCFCNTRNWEIYHAHLQLCHA